MASLKTIVGAALTPLLYLNLALMTGAALFLGLLEMWPVIGVGLFVIIVSRYAIPLLLFPAGVFSRYMIFMRQLKRPRGEKIMMLLSLGYMLAFLAGWCAFFFSFTLEHTPAVAPAALALTWACVLSVGPLLWWVSQDRENVFIIMMVYAIQLGVAGLAAWDFLGTRLAAWPVFGALFSLLMLVAGGQALYEKHLLKER